MVANFANRTSNEFTRWPEDWEEFGWGGWIGETSALTRWPEGFEPEQHGARLVERVTREDQ